MGNYRSRSQPSRLGIFAAAFFSIYATQVGAATTTYTVVYAGGTIAPGDMVLLNNGASVTGNVVAKGNRGSISPERTSPCPARSPERVWSRSPTAGRST